MLQKLFIQNYAIIDSLSIEFSGGLNIITGETGAGKSILAGATGLVLGNRADSAVLFDKEKKCVVEAVFEGGRLQQVVAFLSANELDSGSELVIRRELNASGKSRAFVNDTPVNLSQLNSLSGLLVDLHRQFDTLELGERDFQLQVIDALAGNRNDLVQYKKTYQAFKEVQKEMDSMRAEQAAANREFDYYQFLLEELESAGLKSNELEELDSELQVLSHAEQIKSVLDNISFSLEESDQPLVQQLKSIVQQLQPLSFHEGITGLRERLRSAQLELMDIAKDLQRINQSIQVDEKRMNEVNERIATGYKLLKKHNVQSTAQLLKIQEGLVARQSKVLNLETDIQKKELELKALHEKCVDQAGALSVKRRKVTDPFVKEVNGLLVKVGMPNARVKVALEIAELGEEGADTIEFFFDANKSQRFEPLRKVASGGELSRLMLCIQSLVAGSMQLPTLIFDEIDSGISGEAARQVGLLMKELSLNHQLIAITHQPQIAARADAHYLVFKQEQKGQIRTQIRLLNQPERIEVIAKMLGGEHPSSRARENAKEMVLGNVD